jgi:pimeloyl-ACP methyl ester carboxylesterase
MSLELEEHLKNGRFVSIDGTNIFTIDKGEGEIILLVHGFLGTSYSYRKLIPILSKKNRVIALDLPGIGFSEALPDVYSHRMLANFLSRFISVFSEEPVHLVVHDYAGPISFLLLNLNPEKVKTLTVISSFLYLTKFRFYYPVYLFNLKLIGNLFIRTITPTTLKMVYNSKLMSKGNPLPDATIEDYYHLLFEGTKKNNFLKFCQNVDKTIYAQRDMESGLKKMIGGRQIICAEGEALVSDAQTEYLKEKLRLGIINYLPGKHLLMEESPEQCCEKISILVTKFSRK